tara:strand:- start:314 stop:499 length:186 start_codon:yes stop_codon:yes gene_type:complete
MANYKCDNCKAKRKISKRTIKEIDGTVRVVEALCDCGEYMKDTKEFTGFPNLIRTEPSLKD